MTTSVNRTSYIDGGEEGYLDQMISDLAGVDDTPGAIEDAENNNVEKAVSLQRLGLTFVVMIGILLMMAVFMVFSVGGNP